MQKHIRRMKGAGRRVIIAVEDKKKQNTIAKVWKELYR